MEKRMRCYTPSLMCTFCSYFTLIGGKTLALAFVFFFVFSVLLCVLSCFYFLIFFYTSKNIKKKKSSCSMCGCVFMSSEQCMYLLNMPNVFFIMQFSCTAKQKQGRVRGSFKRIKKNGVWSPFSVALSLTSPFRLFGCLHYRALNFISYTFHPPLF